MKYFFFSIFGERGKNKQKISKFANETSVDAFKKKGIERLHFSAMNKKNSYN